MRKGLLKLNIAAKKVRLWKATWYRAYLEEWIGARDMLPIDCLIANAGVSVSSRNQQFDNARAKAEDALITTNIQGVILLRPRYCSPDAREK